MARYCSQVLSLVTLLLILNNSGVCFCRNSTPFCREQEREALLQLKQSFEDPSRLLSSWKGQDCCKWEGVTCDGVYGHVIKLQLAQPIEGKDVFYLAGELNSSLLHLKYLNFLDFGRINFNYERIPEFLGSMKQLRYLNLSFTNSNGMVPQELGNLTKLEILDLHDGDGNLVVDDTLWISHLQSLKYLDMSGLKIANTKGLLQVISTLPSLSHLSLSSCSLHNFHLSSNHLVNSTSFVHLQYLDLSRNLFHGPISGTPSHNMTSLQHLDLSLNFFNSSIPMWFDKFTSLAHLNLEKNYFDSIEGGLFSLLKKKQYLKSLLLGYNRIGEEISTTEGNSSRFIESNLESLEIWNNHLKGALPNWLVHFTNLKHILLQYNFFSGPIPSVIGSLSNLVILDLSYNRLNGTIPPSLGQLSSLRLLGLSNNQLAGHIPESLGKLWALQYLLLDSNHLNSTIPNSFGKLSHLSHLYLFNNSLGGVISEIHLSNLSRLKELDICGHNNLTFKLKPTWIPPFQLRFIWMKSCIFGTAFPQWIRTQVEAKYITLSNASLFGPLPNWLANLTFDQLDLSYNQITGPLPNISFHCSTLDLSHNKISGSLPTDIGFVYSLETVHLNDNLITGTIPSTLCNLGSLNLANNNLFGSIPDCIEGNLSLLTLSFNKLSGVIPSSIGSLDELKTLHLNGNRLSGELPPALGYCTSLTILDLGENNFSGSIPTWFDQSFRLLSILRLRENRFVGGIPLQLCSLLRLRILDMAWNNLTGTIPRCLGNMSEMINSNQGNPFGSVAVASVQDIISFSYNLDLDWDQEHVVETMKGRHNEYTKVALRLVVNLDLSRNNLIGSIPEELTLLSRLQGLNLSHNFLFGDIPIGIGNMRLLESLDLSNNHLSGKIPQGISALTFLAYLNLSQNNFTGQIPKGNQIQTLDDPSIYVGNPLLCGDLLREKCLGAEAPERLKIPHSKDTHEEDKLEKALFCMVEMLGFAAGFWGFFGVMQFKKDWRHAYFSFVDLATDKAYVAIVVKVAKLKRLRWSRST